MWRLNYWYLGAEIHVWISNVTYATVRGMWVTRGGWLLRTVSMNLVWGIRKVIRGIHLHLLCTWVVSHCDVRVCMISYQPVFSTIRVFCVWFLIFSVYEEILWVFRIVSVVYTSIYSLSVQFVKTHWFYCTKCHHMRRSIFPMIAYW